MRGNLRWSRSIRLYETEATLGGTEKGQPQNYFGGVRENDRQEQPTTRKWAGEQLSHIGFKKGAHGPSKNNSKKAVGFEAVTLALELNGKKSRVLWYW